MTKRSILLVCMCLFALCSLAKAENYHEERQLYEKICLKCHAMSWALWPRSFKGWELTVENMRQYAYDDSMFTEEQGKRITEFLAKYAGEGELIEPAEEMAETPEVEPPVEPVVATDMKPIIEQVTDPKIKISSLKTLWNPSRNALLGARVSGFVAVACLLGLLASGFLRRKLKVNFRKIHVKLALGLFLSLAAHGIIYIFEYGTPSVTWYWFGLIGFILLIITQLQGIVRKRFRKGLLISHIIGACIGLIMSILHWVWAWI